MAIRRDRAHTKLCRNYALGHCPQGNNCNYIHASPETIQTATISPFFQPSLSQRSADDSSATFSPLQWPTFSPITNASSDYLGYQYQWGTPTTAVDANPPSSQMKYRPLSWRTTLCKHYLKNRGWCPVGDDCNYIHDLTLADFAKEDARFSNVTAKRNERGRAGRIQSHCWAYIQGLCHVQDCPYLHPAAPHMFSQYTPCLAWPNCRRGPLCPYKHPEPYISRSPTASPVYTGVPAPAMQRDAIPRGAMPPNGMFYFSTPQQQAPPPPPMLASPVLPLPGHQPPVVFTNPWDAWPLPYASPPRMPFAPFLMSSHRPTWPGDVSRGPTNPQPPPPLPPTQPRFSLSAFSPIDRAVSPPPLPHAFALADAQQQRLSVSSQRSEAPVAPRAASSLSIPPPEPEFPFTPPKHQRVGHARRVSVAIQSQSQSQSQSRADLEALGLDSAHSPGRLPWQTHAHLLARRSWAPSSSSSSSVLRGKRASSPALLHGY